MGPLKVLGYLLSAVAALATIIFIALQFKDRVFPPQLPTPTPIEVEMLTVLGSVETGEPFPVEMSGVGGYLITVESGAYSPWPSDDHPGNQGWLTMLYVYKTRDVEWDIRESGLEGPVNPDYEIGDGEPQLKREDAERSARGMRITVELQGGDYLTFVPLDERAFYYDNRGDVILSIRRVS